MGTFMGRRYLRRGEQVGTTEKVLGGVILLLVVGIVVTFVVQVTANREYLFDVDPAAYQAGEKSRELAAAQQMLPALSDPRWRGEEVEVLSAAELPEALGGDASTLIDFGVRQVYRRRYVSADEPRQEIAAMVCDAASPAQAFGLCAARRPLESAAFRTGRDGWSAQNGSRIGFWNGRHYTELWTSSPTPEATATVTTVAQAIAAAQLSYGSSFPAEEMLPSAGRVPGSFRYVHRAALGLEPLNEAFLVDLTGGLTAWVVDARTAARTREVTDVLKAQAGAATGPEAGYEYAEPGMEKAAAPQYLGPLTVIPFRSGYLAFFSLGTRLQGVWGDDFETVVGTANGAYERALEASADTEAAVAAPAPAEPESPFPDPGLQAWQPPDQVSRYTPETLYQKINGRADLYLQFHVVGLTFGTYTHRTEADRTLDVYWYDMGKPDNAFGMYRAEAPPDARQVPIGRDGYETGGAVFFWKGPSYVQVLPTGFAPEDADAALEVAKRLAARIEDAGEEAWALNVLPKADRVDDSLEYVAQDAFGLDFLGDVFTADYELEGSSITLFIHRADDVGQAAVLFERYVESLRKYGRVFWEDPDAARPIVAGEVVGMIDVVFAKGRYLGGVAGADDAEVAKQAATAFYDELPAP